MSANEPIRKLNDIVTSVKASGIKRVVAVAAAEDINTIGAIAKATKEGLIKPYLFGNQKKIEETCKRENIDTSVLEIFNEVDMLSATNNAMKAVKSGNADVLMKGLVGTDKFLSSILDKKEGLILPNAVLSYVCALELPKYNKLLIVSDTAVLPFPDLKQKVSMVNYALDMARKMGIDEPKVALISASEKHSSHFTSHDDYAVLCTMARRNQFGKCIMDGPLDIFLACHPESLSIKEVDTPIKGEADILIFPSIETANAFYKGLMLFAEGELAGLIQGTSHPVVVMSRSESPASKYYCVALACLMCN